jgi:formylglycine-generating enzyme required for sulfatase activity
METKYRDSLVWIKSDRPANTKLGTGFIIEHNKQGTLILTCEHVARDVLAGGTENTLITRDTDGNEYEGTVIIRPTSNPEIDLAVIRVSGDALQQRHKLPLLNVEDYILERSPHILAFKAPWGEQKKPDFYRYAFKTPLPPNFTLENDPNGVPIGKGDSGAPVFDPKSGMVIGVAYRTPDMGGEHDVIYVIAISQLKKIWSDMPGSLLRLPDEQAITEMENEIAVRVKTFGKPLKLTFLIAAMQGDKQNHLNQETAIIKDTLQKVLLDSSFKDQFDVDILEWTGRDQLERALSTNPISEHPPNLNDITILDTGIILLHERSNAPENTQSVKEVVAKVRALAQSNPDGRPLHVVYVRKRSHRVEPAVQLLLDELEARDVDTRVYDTNSDTTSRRSEFNQLFIEDFRRILDYFVTRHLERGGADSLSTPLKFRNPYKGLDVYTADDGSLFFGRFNEVNDLLKLLSEGREGFIAIVGASGSGKSSVARAGLLHRLQLNAIPGSEAWEIIEIKLKQMDKRGKPLPPLEIVATELYKRLDAEGDVHYESIDDLEQRLTAPATIEDVVKAVIGATTERRMLFFIDQFEELFTLHPGSDGEQSRLNFTTFLLEAVANKRVNVIITVRSDFYAHCGESNMSDLFNEGQYLLGSASTAARLMMITRPAVLSGLSFDPYLQQRIIFDMGDSSGALPLMSYLLQKLAERRTIDNRLTSEAYQELGGVQGAIESAAEQCVKDLKLKKKFSEEEIKAAIQTLFRKLVTISQDDRPTKRPTSYDSRALRRDWTPEALALANALVNARLLQTDKDASNKPILEITHERLLHSWRRLEDWITKTRGALLDRERAEIAAQEWIEARIKFVEGRLPARTRTATSEPAPERPSDEPAAAPEAATPGAATEPSTDRTIAADTRVEPVIDVQQEAARSALNQRLAWLGIEQSRFSAPVQAWMKRMPRDFYAALRNPLVDHQHLWDQQRLQLLGTALKQLGVETGELSPELRAFLRPEAERLVEELALESTRHDRRKAIGERLAEIGDPRPGVGVVPNQPVDQPLGTLDDVPDFVWCKVAGGKVRLRMDDGSSVEVGEVKPFYIAQYLVTVAQWRVFWKEGDKPTLDRFSDPENWEGLHWWHTAQGAPKDSPRFPPYTAYSSEQYDNHPVEWATWYQAVAYTRALNRLFGCGPGNIRLPTEWEWQLAAGGGEPDYKYPWGSEWEPTRANTKDGGSYSLVAAGLYPHGASPCGALDMIGNCYQWCQNLSDLDGDLAAAISYSGDPTLYRATRGIAWFYTKLADKVKEDAVITRRFDERPDGRQKEKEGHIRVGIRLACDAPPAGSKIIDLTGVTDSRYLR